MRYLFIFFLFFSSLAQAETTYYVVGSGPFAGYPSLLVPSYGVSANLACMRALPVAIAAVGDNYWGPASVTGNNCYFGSQLYGPIQTEACPSGELFSSSSGSCKPVCPQDFFITIDDPQCIPPVACEQGKSDGFDNIYPETGQSYVNYCTGTCQFNYVWNNDETECYYHLDDSPQHIFCNLEKIENGQSCTTSSHGSVDSRPSGDNTTPAGAPSGTGGDTGGTGGTGTGGTGGTGTGGTGGTGTGGTSGAYGGPSAGQIGSAVAGAMSSLFGANPNAFNAAPSAESVSARDAADSAVSDAVSGWAAFDPANSAKDNFRNITSDWFAVIPSEGCSTLSSHIGPYLWTWDPCPTAGRVSEIASYAMWFYFAASVFTLLMGRVE